jgi:hypothetical protein
MEEHAVLERTSGRLIMDTPRLGKTVQMPPLTMLVSQVSGRERRWIEGQRRRKLEQFGSIADVS